MKMTAKVKEILSYYESDSPGTKANIARMLMHGKLAGTGNMVILPVDQGIEHSGKFLVKACFSQVEPQGYVGAELAVRNIQELQELREEQERQVVYAVKPPVLQRVDHVGLPGSRHPGDYEDGLRRHCLLF